MDLHVGDRVELKKKHPCGGANFEIMREGMDFRLKCEMCGSMIWLKRRDLDKR
ncbi:MAG: DUF951 domain-containing protein [Clostridiales Family XIII bacterium]|jgi:hypothetical protein|nr:DUF951 domain-containing protein [Clostridiales Family XIII bacterium]